MNKDKIKELAKDKRFKSIASVICVFLVGALILTGCRTNLDYGSMVRNGLSKPLATSTNRNKKHLRYYVSPGVGVQETTELSSLLNVQGNSIMMTLNVSQIIAQIYYDETNFESKLDKEQFVYTQSGTYLDSQDQERNFTFSVVDLGNKKGIILEDGVLELIGVAENEDVAYVVDTMFVTLRSSVPDKQEIANLYSNKEIINYKSVHKQFFEHKLPETGSLLEIYNQLHPDDAVEVEGDTE